MADAIMPLPFGAERPFGEDEAAFRRVEERVVPVLAVVVDLVDFEVAFEVAFDDFELDDAGFRPDAEAELDFAFFAPDDLPVELFFAADELEDDRPVAPFDAGLDFEVDDFAELDFEPVDFFAVGILIPP